MNVDKEGGGGLIQTAAADATMLCAATQPLYFTVDLFLCNYTTVLPDEDTTSSTVF